MPYTRDELRWNGWGKSSVDFDFHGHEEAAWKFVSGAIGASSLPRTPATTLGDARLPERRLDDRALEPLGKIVGSDHVRTDRRERAFHAYGRSYHDLIRLRSGDVSCAPDAVVYPGTHDEVLAVLSHCAAHGIAVVPFGGGSSVVGGVTGKDACKGRPLVSLDTTRLSRILSVDALSRTATAQAGMYGPDLERELGDRGLTVGHFPQSFEYSTLGGWIAARGAGQLSNRYGAAVDLVVGLRVATPRGELTTLGFPNSAAGPSLNALLAGSEGALGVITEATMRVQPVAPARRIVAFLFRAFEGGVATVRRAVHEEVGAAMIRLSDADETRFYGEFRHALEPSRAMGLAEKALGVVGFRDKCVLMACFEGEEKDVRSSEKKLRAIVRAEGGLWVGPGPGRSWWKRRFQMPYMRDPMLDRGVGVDTLETATRWSNVLGLHAAVRRAIEAAAKAEGRGVIVMSHISHSYPDGASLYFTFVFERDQRREVEQWRAMKEAASRAISDNGGTISHHHGVGEDHAHWLPPEKGALGMGALRALKDELDPEGIMNPGKLLSRV